MQAFFYSVWDLFCAFFFFLEFATIKLTIITKKRIVSTVLVIKLSKISSTPEEKMPTPSNPQSIKDCLSDNILNSGIITWCNTV